jgi:hypothetical protein
LLGKYINHAVNNYVDNGGGEHKNSGTGEDAEFLVIDPRSTAAPEQLNGSRVGEMREVGCPEDNR